MKLLSPKFIVNHFFYVHIHENEYYDVSLPENFYKHLGINKKEIKDFLSYAKYFYAIKVDNFEITIDIESKKYEIYKNHFSEVLLNSGIFYDNSSSTYGKKKEFVSIEDALEYFGILDKYADIEIK